MTKDLDFRVILLSISEKSKDDKESIAFVLAALFEVPEDEIRRLLDQLPVVIFDNLNADDLKKVKDRLIFLSKMGLDFHITFKPFPALYRTGWKIKASTPVLACPACGEEFILLRSQDIPSYVSQRKHRDRDFSSEFEERKEPAPRQPATESRELPPPKSSGTEEKRPVISAPEKKSTPAKSSDSISSPPPPSAGTPHRHDLEMEDIEVLTEELEAMVCKEEELAEEPEEIEEIESISAEVPKVSAKTSKMPEIGCISAEFEEIEGVSGEFENSRFDSMDEDIGSLSAELEEISGISAELDAANEDADLSPKGKKPVDVGFDEMEEISQDFDASEKEADKKSFPPKAPTPLAAQPPPAAVALKPAEVSPVAPASTSPALPPMYFPEGNFDVIVNFSKGNIEMGIRLLARMHGVTYEEIKGKAMGKISYVAVSGVSQKAAEGIVKQFQRLEIQGKIFPTRPK